MRVGVFLGEFTPEIGGGYTFVNDVAEAFFLVAGESTHDFFVFCPPEAVNNLKKLNLPKNIKLIPLAKRGIVARGIATLKHISPVFSLLWRFPCALEIAARQQGVQVMWFVGGFFDTLDIPYIANVWDLQHLTHPWFPEVSAKGRWEYRELFLQRHLRRAARVITGTEVGKGELVSFYRLPENRIAILPHPTPAFALEKQDVNKEYVINKFGLRDGFVLYPAQFWAHKNHMVILLALSLLKQEGYDFPDVAFVGSDKGNRNYVMEKSADLGIADKVHCLGFVSVEDLVGLYKSAAALLYASFSGPENLPPLEAFALSCPVIASDFLGAREQMGDAAMYFDPHNPETLAIAIKNFMKEGSEKGRRVEQGLARAQKWTGKDYVRKVISLINDFEHERSCWK